MGKLAFYLPKNVLSWVLCHLVGGTIQVKKIRENWDEILRLVSSVRQGTVTASLILKKLSSYPRQNSLSIALTGDYIWNLNQELNFESLQPLRKNKIKQE
ncbi:TPA: Tn3 family transposase [Bacillus cereus]|nr:Tn3 family transposase [Bacillus cereus]